MQNRITRIFPDARKTKQNHIGYEVERFPFFIKSISFYSERTLQLEKETELTDHFILYVVSGSANFSYQSTTCTVRENDLVFVSCTSPIKFISTGAQKWDCLWMIANGDSMKLYYNIIRGRNLIMKVNPLSPVLDLLLELYNTDYDGSIHSHVTAARLLHELLYQMYSISCNTLAAKKGVPIQDTEVKRALSFIEKNYNRRITIDAICNEVCLSKYYFCKIFKEHTGMTLLCYLNQYRVNRSKDLLLYSKLSIESISTSVGFANALTYIRNFKKDTDMTPSEFRACS